MNTDNPTATAQIYAGERGKLILKFEAVWFADGVGGFTLPGEPSSEIEMLRAIKRGLADDKQVRHDQNKLYDFVVVAPMDWDIDAVTIAFFDMLEQMNGLGGRNANLN